LSRVPPKSFFVPPLVRTTLWETLTENAAICYKMEHYVAIEGRRFWWQLCTPT